VGGVESLCDSTPEYVSMQEMNFERKKKEMALQEVR
jgi:hypothetical protein